MEIISRELADVLGRVCLGGIIKEAVIRSTQEGITIASTDQSDTMYCEIHSNISFGEKVIGVGDLPLLIKYLMGNENLVDIAIQDNRLVCTKGTANFKYLLTEPEIIATAPQTPPENGIGQVLSIPLHLELTEVFQEEYKRMASIIKPRTVTISMGQRGRVMFNAGAESSHQFSTVGGMIAAHETLQAPYEAITVNVLGEQLTAVMGVLKKSQKAFMYLPPESSCAIFMQDTNFWLLKPVLGGDDV